MKISHDFKRLLKLYINIKGLDIIIFLTDGKSIELNKNRALIKNDIVVYDKHNRETRIPLQMIKSVDFYAA